MEGPPVWEPFDHEITLLYKYADVLQKPTRYFASRPRMEGDFEEQGVGTEDTILFPLDQEMAFQLEQGQSLDTLYAAWKDFFRMEDVVLTYFDLKSEESLDTRWREINDFYFRQDPTAPPRYLNSAELMQDYRSWAQALQDDFEKEREKIDALHQVQEKLRTYAEEEHFRVSPLQFKQRSVRYRGYISFPEGGEREVTPPEGLDLFQGSTVSPSIPYLQYNDSKGQRFYKIFRGIRGDFFPQDTSWIPSSEKMSENDTLYLIWWKSEEVRAEAFQLFVYSLEFNRLDLDIRYTPGHAPEEEEDQLLDQMQTIFPSILWREREDLGLLASVEIFGLAWDALTFAHTVMFDETLLSKYLFVQETSHPLSLMKRAMNIRYKPLGMDLPEHLRRWVETTVPYSITLSAERAFPQEYFDLIREDPEGGEETIEKMAFKEPTPYISLRMSRVPSLKRMTEMIRVLRILLVRYESLRAKTTAFYRDCLPLVPWEEEVPGEEPERKPLKTLKEIAPELTFGYSRRCQGKEKQPDVFFKPQEIERWQKETFLYKGDTRHRQVLSFPKEDPYLYFVCTHPENPFPGLQVNREAKTKDQFPYTPCCFKNDQMTPKLRGKPTLYQQVYLSLEPKEEKGPGKILKQTKRLLTPGGMGELPESIVQVLKQYTETEGDFKRYGVLRSPNSFLHAVCLAVRDPEYEAQGTWEEKETYVRAVRSFLAENLFPSLFKQELFDFTEHEIAARLAEGERYLDPSEFYRAIEEAFGIQVYVYGVSEDSAGQESTILLPRHKYFHARPFRALPTLLILKNWGGKAETLTEPQSELIIQQPKGREPRFLFSSEMGKIQYRLLHAVSRLLVWSFSVDGEVDRFSIQQNPFSLWDLESLFQGAVKSQYVDAEGKARAWIFRASNGELVTLMVPPSQPGNLPSFTEPTFPRASLETVESFLGAPRRGTFLPDGFLDGAWFGPTGNEVYVPVRPTEKYRDLPLGDPNPLSVEEDPSVERLRKLRQDLDWIVQWMKWLFLLAVLQGQTREQFIENYLSTERAWKGDSATFYDLSSLPRHFPPSVSPEEAMDALEPLAPTLFSEGRMVLYNENFQRKMLQMLEQYEQQISDQEVDLPVVLENYYTRPEDFQPPPEVAVFLSEKAFREWLESVSPRAQRLNLYTQFDPMLAFTLEPFLYQNERGKLYVVQNVVHGDWDRAIRVAVEWMQWKLNRGSFTPPWDLAEPLPYLLYGLSSTQTMILREDHRNGAEEYLSLLQWNGEQYAALLEFL